MLLEYVKSLLNTLRSTVEENSHLDWQIEDGFLPLIVRAVVRRQFDALEATVHLVENSRGFAAAPLLRVACEELIWLKYLQKIGNENAERLIFIVSVLETADSLQAQEEYAGVGVMKNLGLDSYSILFKARKDDVKEKLSEFANGLNWPRRTRESGSIPSMAFLANEVGETNLYNFLYHASSRYVHFSPIELLRRSWGTAGEVSMESKNFDQYWGNFTLYWKTRVIVDVLITSLKWKDLNWSDAPLEANELLEAAKKIGEHGAVPIITAEELAWEWDPKPIVGKI